VVERRKGLRVEWRPVSAGRVTQVLQKLARKFGLILRQFVDEIVKSFFCRPTWDPSIIPSRVAYRFLSCASSTAFAITTSRPDNSSPILGFTS